MPAGVTNGPVHCNKCDGKEFKTFSDLRKHQWEAHQDSFANLKKAAKRYHRKIKLKPQSNGNVSAQDLLQKLRAQRDFMNDIVSMVEGMLK